MNKFVDDNRQDEEYKYSTTNDTNRENRSIKMINQSPNANTDKRNNCTPQNDSQNI